MRAKYREAMAFRITTVCQGNICRSPMAAAVLRHRLAATDLADDVRVDSAGTAGYHVGEAADPRAEETLREAGYGIAHAARKVTVGVLGNADLVLAMDRANADALRDLAERGGVPHDHVFLLRSFDGDSPEGAEVPDPYYGGHDGFREVLDMIERAVDGVIAHVRGELGK